MKAARKIKKTQVGTFRKNPLLTEDVQHLATKYLGKRDKKNMFYLPVEFLVMNCIMEVFANIFQITTFHSCLVSHRYNRVPRLLHVSQESIFFDKQHSNNAASHLSFSNHMLAFHISDMK